MMLLAMTFAGSWGIWLAMMIVCIIGFVFVILKGFNSARNTLGSDQPADVKIGGFVNKGIGSMKWLFIFAAGSGIAFILMVVSLIVKALG